MTNQIIEVPDISIVKYVNGTKQLLSLQDQKIKKDGSLQNFGTGSGVKYQGDLYVLKNNAVVVPDNFHVIIKATTVKQEVTFYSYKQSDVYTDWGDGTIDKNVDNHTYSDGLETHDISIYSKNHEIATFVCDDNGITFLDISGAIMLKNFTCNNNPLTELICNPSADMYKLEASCCLLSNLSQMPNSVKDLNLSNNLLSSLENFSSRLKLGISILDLSHNTQLTSFIIEEGSLGHLNVDGCTGLEYLACNFNKLTILSFKGCTSLKELYCAGNNIESNFMKAENCPNLEKINFSSNPFILKETGLKNFVNTLPDRNNNPSGTLEISNPDSALWIQAICNAKNWNIY